MRNAYVDSFAQMMTARGYTSEFLSSGTKEANQAVYELQKYATQEAREATFNDANKVAEFISETQRKAMNGNLATKAAGVMIEGTLPFKKVPANAFKRGIEYSPVGLLKGIVDCKKSVESGKISASDAINNLSKGITGTGIFVLGAFLKSIGMLANDTDDDENLKAYKKDLGRQGYSLVLGSISYSLDWVSPSNLSLFAGAEMYDLVKDGNKNPITAVIDAVAGMSEPLFELSCLQGVKDAFETAKYSEKNPVTDVALAMVSSYISQAFPTIGGQTARIIDGTRRNAYYTDKNSIIPEAIDSFIKKSALKIPGATFLLDPKIDVWGNEMKYEGNVATRIIQNTVSPGYLSSNKETITDKKIIELYNKTGEKSVIPKKADKSFKVNGEMKYLTGKEYTDFAKKQGKMSYKYVESFTQSLNYASLDDDVRVNVIDDLYSYARYKAREEICKEYEMPKEYQKVKEAEESGIKPEQYITARAVIKGIESDKTSSGKTINYSKSTKEMSEISKNVNGLSDNQKRKLFEIMGYTNKQIIKFMYGNPLPKKTYVGLPKK